MLHVTFSDETVLSHQCRSMDIRTRSVYYERDLSGFIWPIRSFFGSKMSPRPNTPRVHSLIHRRQLELAVRTIVSPAHVPFSAKRLARLDRRQEAKLAEPSLADAVASSPVARSNRIH